MGGGVTFRVSLHERLKIINPSQNQVCRSNLISKKVTNIALIYILTFELKLLKKWLEEAYDKYIGTNTIWQLFYQNSSYFNL